MRITDAQGLLRPVWSLPLARIAARTWVGLLDWPLLGGLLRPSLSISTLGSLKLQGHTKYLTSVSAQD